MRVRLFNRQKKFTGDKLQGSESPPPSAIAHAEEAGSSISSYREGINYTGDCFAGQLAY